MNVEKIYENDRIIFWRGKRNADFIKLLARRASYYAVHPRVDEFCRNKTPELIYKYARNKIVYRKDPRISERILSPSLIIDEWSKNKKVVGDCDDKSLFLASCLANMGYSVRLVGAMFKKIGATGINHVYVEFLMNNRWIPLEPSTRILHFGEKSPRVVPILRVKLSEPNIKAIVEAFTDFHDIGNKDDFSIYREAVWTI